MEHFFLIIAILSFIISGTVCYFLKKSFPSIVLSIVAPAALLFFYVFLMRDEFGYWALALTIGICYSLITSILATLLVSHIVKIKYQT